MPEKTNAKVKLSPVDRGKIDMWTNMNDKRMEKEVLIKAF